MLLVGMTCCLLQSSDYNERLEKTLQAINNHFSLRTSKEPVLLNPSIAQHFTYDELLSYLYKKKFDAHWDPDFRSFWVKPSYYRNFFEQREQHRGGNVLSLDPFFQAMKEESDNEKSDNDVKE